jgi:hypothetical protein
MFLLEMLLELILSAVLCAGAYFGIKRGFVSIMAKPVKVFASIMLAMAICTGVARTIVVPIIDAPITNYIASFLYDNCSSITPEITADELPTLLKISAAIFNIDVYAVAVNANGKVIEAIVANLAEPAIYVIAVIIAFVLTYILGRLLFSLALFLIDVLVKGGLFGKINKSLGVVFGISIAFICAWATVGFISFALSTPMFASNVVSEDFRGGLLYRFFNNFSPIELLLRF